MITETWNQEHALDIRARKQFGSNFLWPYGAGSPDVRSALLDWAEPLGLRQSNGKECLHWLRTGRCSVSGCSHTVRFSGKNPYWADHVTTWLAPKGRLLVSQPYQNWRDIGRWLDKETFDDLDIEVRSTGWYSSSACFIGLWSR